MNTLMFHGYKVIANPILTKTETREVKRTWKERLFTRPWRPLKVTRTESYQVPDRDVLVDKINKVIYAHPSVVKELEKAIGERHLRDAERFGIFNPATFNVGRGADWFRGGA